MKRLRVALLLCGLMLGCAGQSQMRTPPDTAAAASVVDSDRRSAFAQAYGSYRRGDLAGALPVFTTLATSYPELGDYHLYFAGVIAVKQGRDRDAEDAFTRLLRDYPQSVHAAATEVELGKVLDRDGASEPARLHLQRALTAPDASTAQAARLALAEIDARSGDVAAAYTGFMTVRRAGVGSAMGRSAKQQALALRAEHPELAPQGAQRLDDAHLLLAEHDYAAATAAATQLLERPEDVDPAEALRVRADALYGQGKVEGALAALQELTDRYPHSPAAPPAMLRSATVLWNRDQDATALTLFEEFQRRYPGDARASEALYATGRIHQSAGRTSVALETFAAVAQRYPQSKDAPEARWRIGWIHYTGRDWAAAAAAFAELASHSESRQRDGALYWQARSLEHAGRAAAATNLYQAVADAGPSSYYAMWAQQRLGASPGTPQPRAVVNHDRGGPLGPAPLTDTFHLTRYDELRAAGLNRLARTELAAVESDHRDDTDTLRYLLRAYPTVDGYTAALRLARRLDANAGLSPSERERLLYPLAFWDDVRPAATTQGVDPLLVVAVMRQESLFDPNARSPADARGLMQLLPSTAERVAAGSGAGTDPSDLTEPSVNIQLGTRYLRTLLDRFDGDILKAVAAYNGGENAVEKWEVRFPDLTPDEFVENISYRETRDYVKRVVANYRTYQQLYTN